MGLATAASQPSPMACRASPVASSGRPPIRSDRAPGDGGDRSPASRSRAGSAARPAAGCSAGRPAGTARAGRSSRTSRRTSAAMRRWSGEAAAAEQCMGSIGSRAPQFPGDERGHQERADHDGRQHRGAVQPWSLPRTTPSTMPNRPTLARTRPGRSRLVERPAALGEPGPGDRQQPMPIGTFNQKIHCQDAPSTTAPPTSGPMAMARPPTAPQAPRARPRRSGVTAADSSVRVSGITMAAPTPWTARAATRRRCRAPARRPPTRR